MIKLISGYKDSAETELNNFFTEHPDLSDYKLYFSTTVDEKGMIKYHVLIDF